MIYLEIFKALIYTAVFSLLITPFDFLIARAIGAIDIPTDSRRMHSSPIPRSGGISMFAAFAAFGLFFCSGPSPASASIILGAVIIVTLGIADDASNLSAKIKLTVQAVAAVITVSGVTHPARDGWGFFIIGVLWVLTLTNAHNFIDGLDGLCAGVSLCESCALGASLLHIGEPFLALLSFTLGGACLGFLPYNDKKAKIFMGDTGSAFLGFVISTLSLRILDHAPSAKALISISLILFLPLCDISFAILRRISQGKSIFSSDRSHIHHILADSSLGHRRASLILRFVSSFFAAAGALTYIIF